MVRHTAVVHDTLVIHGPVDTGRGTGEMAGTTDLENLMILALARHEKSVRATLKLSDDFTVKYIATGSNYLVAKNEVSVDVAGGEYDQHNFPENWKGTVRTSIDAVLEASQIAVQYLGFMHPLFNSVSRNDATGEAVAVESDEMKTMRLASVTPHTKTDLRTLVKGWNKMYRYTPRTIEHLAELAFKGIFALLEDKFVKELDVLEAEGAAHGWSREVIDGKIAAIERDEMPHRRDDSVFMFSNIVKGLTLYLKERGEGDRRMLPESKQRGIVKWFSDRCVLALKAWEQEWRIARKDFDTDGVRMELEKSPAYVRRVRDRRTMELILVRRNGPVLLVAGQSESDRYPEVLRAYAREVYYHKLGVDEADPLKRRAVGRKRYYKEHARPPVVIIHFRKSTGKFFVTSDVEGFAMHDVAAAIRIADLVKRNARIPRSEFEKLREQGGVLVSDGRGALLVPFYFPFPTGFGNMLITNPFMVPTVLGVEDIWTLVRNVILNQVVFPDETLPCKSAEPKCIRECRYYWYDHAGCNEFRLSAPLRSHLSVVR
jgi:hypothetical protein